VGKIPFEVHFEHCFHNPVNEKYGFINNTARGTTAKLSNLIGMIQHSFAFIGVASGPWVTAMSVMPLRTMFLKRNHQQNNYLSHPASQVDINDYREGAIKRWLKTL
jgi:hypothetical protein